MVKQEGRLLQREHRQGDQGLWTPQVCRQSRTGC